jgi:hypothetical protein
MSDCTLIAVCFVGHAKSLGKDLNEKSILFIFQKRFVEKETFIDFKAFKL